jgi:hypothetical protein
MTFQMHLLPVDINQLQRLLPIILPVKYYLTVDGTISASNTSTTAFNTGSFPAGSSLYLTNNNYIVGAGGNGGNANGGGGSNGGPALTLNLTTFITNNGTIGGGGGGGGAGSGGCFTQCAASWLLPAAMLYRLC